MTSDQKTKYLFLVGDGMADYPISELGGKTPLEAAHTPNMDFIASRRIGRLKTIPEGMEPGSDVANLSLLGYDPRRYHTGRSPLEAASMGVTLRQDDLAFRMNLVTLNWGPGSEIIMKSHSSGDITTPEAKHIVETLTDELVIRDAVIYAGVAYRHLLVWKKGPENLLTIPPHDVLDRDMALYLNGNGEDPIPGIIRSSWPLLKDHPVNISRAERGLSAANSIWLWGQGKAPTLPLFEKKYGLKGGVISAVDLLKGIGIYSGFCTINVEGATGYLDTNYLGKAESALKALDELDFVFVHVEAPDEAGHNGSFKDKIKAIQDFDKKVVGTALKGLARFDDYRIAVASDHFTPVIKKTHTSEPAPFAWASKRELGKAGKNTTFSEKQAVKSGLFFENGHEMIDSFIGAS